MSYSFSFLFVYFKKDSLHWLTYVDHLFASFTYEIVATIRVEPKYGNNINRVLRWKKLMSIKCIGVYVFMYVCMYVFFSTVR